MADLSHLAHADDCTCIPCKVRSLSVAKARKEVDAKDKTLSADLAAYKRLRHDGLQPSAIDGSAALEGKVESQMDITLGRYVPRSEMDRVREGFAISKELGLTTVVPD